MGTPMIEEREEYEGLEELETDLNPFSQRSKRKRVGMNNKRDNIGLQMCDQFDRIIEVVTVKIPLLLQTLVIFLHLLIA